MTAATSTLTKYLTVLLPVVVACSENEVSVAAANVRDSAGITIVENPLPQTAPTFVLSGPILEIGEVSGAEEYELDNVAAIAPLSDGSVAVATGGTEIRWYDADGRFRQRAGGAGGGPGEFQSIRYMRRLAGDSLLVYDGRHRRVTRFASDGSYVRDEAVRQDGEAPPMVSAALVDGSLLTRTTVEMPPASTPLYRAQQAFAVQRGDSTQPLRQYPGPETALHVDGSGGDIRSIFIFRLPFGRAAYASSGSDRFFIGSSDSYDVDVWNAAGQLVRIIRVDVPIRPVTDELLSAYVEGEIERRRQMADQGSLTFNEAESRQQLRDLRHAPAVPAYSSILGTGDGGLWVNEFKMPGAESTAQRWTVFDVEGRVVGTIDLPDRFTPMHVDEDVLWGVSLDALDVPYVHAYTFGVPAG
jgi:hypothetical protein